MEEALTTTTSAQDKGILRSGWFGNDWNVNSFSPRSDSDEQTTDPTI
ncbi:hypothetical protein J31TS3_22160 [Paenibacillus lactis]|nr:hypothetical protein J31TS3_22160 [Paenibacillus lactis]